MCCCRWRLTSSPFHDLNTFIILAWTRDGVMDEPVDMELLATRLRGNTRVAPQIARHYFINKQLSYPCLRITTSSYHLPDEVHCNVTKIVIREEINALIPIIRQDRRTDIRQVRWTCE